MSGRAVAVLEIVPFGEKCMAHAPNPHVTCSSAPTSRQQQDSRRMSQLVASAARCGAGYIRAMTSVAAAFGRLTGAWPGDRGTGSTVSCTRLTSACYFIAEGPHHLAVQHRGRPEHSATMHIATHCNTSKNLGRSCTGYCNLQGNLAVCLGVGGGSLPALLAYHYPQTLIQVAD